MTDYRSLFEKKYLGSWDVPEDRDVVVVIARVVSGTIEGGPGIKKAKKGMLYFSNVRNTDKPMVFGATVGKTIASLYGKEIEGWIGKPIALYRTTTSAQGGEIVECIRVRPEKPAMPKAKDGPALSAVPEEREPGEEQAS